MEEGPGKMSLWVFDGNTEACRSLQIAGGYMYLHWIDVIVVETRGY